MLKSREPVSPLLLAVLFVISELVFTYPVIADEPDARALIRAAMDHWRGLSSYTEMTMTVQRREWQRRFSMQAWTQGDKLSLVRVTAPKRDAGNGTLVQDRSMWTYSPKINRIVKVPSSLMNQSWLGSDFSNRDISKTTEVINQYDHRLLETTRQNGHQIYTIESIPHEDAAVVWGKEVFVIRDDFVMLRQEFWDQDGILIKSMEATEIDVMDERTIATRLRMSKVENPQEWTEMTVDAVDFDIELKSSLFTLSNLRNPRP